MREGGIEREGREREKEREVFDLGRSVGRSVSQSVSQYSHGSNSLSTCLHVR